MRVCMCARACAVHFACVCVRVTLCVCERESVCDCVCVVHARKLNTHAHTISLTNVGWLLVLVVGGMLCKSDKPSIIIIIINVGNM